MTRDTFMGRSIYPTAGKKSVPLGARIYPVRKASVRLKLGVFNELISELKVLLKLPGDLYDQMYHQLLENYANFVQLLPEQEAFPSHSMLGNSLKRSYTVLKAFLPLIEAREGKRFMETDRGSRLVYAVFSAMLLFRVAKLFGDKHISLCDQQGKFIANWRYYDEPMTANARYFRMRSGQCMPPQVISDMTLVIAKQIMPVLGFSWLAEDKVLLGHWFKALNIYDELFGVHDINLDIEALMQASQLDIKAESDYEVADGVLLGEAFWEWLSDHIANQRDAGYLTESGYGLVDGELLFDVDKMADRFAKEKQASVSQVIEQFSQLGIIQVKDGEIVCRHLSALKSQSGVGASGLYAQRPHYDQMDAKRFVGIDSVLASACIKGYNGLTEQEYLKIEQSHDGIIGRLLGKFMSGLLGGANMDLTSGRQ